MNSFLFITHITPRAKRSPLRSALYEVHLNSILNQTYDNWKVLCFGEEEKKDSKFFQLRLNQEVYRSDISNQLAELYSREDVLDYINKSDYLVKLDDDDIISPNILERLANFKGDVYYDEFHAFYDITSTQVSSQKRNWIASTCIQKTSLALAKIRLDGPNNIYLNSVFYSDHSQVWHKYYADKQKFVADRIHPVYLRILSPTSITAGAGKSPLNKFEEIDFDLYYSYLSKFGDWDENLFEDFKIYKKSLQDAWFEFSGFESRKIPLKSINFFERISKSLIRYVGKGN